MGLIQIVSEEDQVEAPVERIPIPDELGGVGDEFLDG